MTVRASKPRQSCHSVHPGIRQPPQGPASSLILHSSLGPGRWHVPCSTTAGRRGHGEGIFRVGGDSRGGGRGPDGAPRERGGGRGGRRGGAPEERRPRPGGGRPGGGGQAGRPGGPRG